MIDFVLSTLISFTLPYFVFQFPNFLPFPFLQGKLKIQGNMGLAMKLQELQKTAGEALKAKL